MPTRNRRPEAQVMPCDRPLPIRVRRHQLPLPRRELAEKFLVVDAHEHGPARVRDERWATRLHRDEHHYILDSLI